MRRTLPYRCLGHAEIPSRHHARRTALPQRGRLSAPALNLTQDLLVSDAVQTGRVMVKDEDVCLHCGMCAERCPTGAWDMQKYFLELTHAGPGCRDGAPARKAA